MSEKGSETGAEELAKEALDRLNELSGRYSLQSVKGAFEKLQGTPYEEQDWTRGEKPNEDFSNKVENEVEPLIVAYGVDIVKEAY